jgi:serine/threonine-protein kinase
MTAAAEDRERVGPYRVIQAIGAGGSARIDLARLDRAYGFQRHVVLKRPLEHLRGDASVAASLRREARIGGRLRHPNLVAVLDAGVHDGHDYLVLEYVHGAALRAVMHAEVPGQVRDLPIAIALAIVADAARGVHEAHELTDDSGAPLGLVHRDVSPGNILIGLDGAVKLADFGIAKETRVSTLSGSMRGTVTYMAPEQCQGHAYDRRADVFSLGVILYELVTGRRLFWADNDVASLHRVLSGVVPRPRTHKPALAAALEDIVMTAVAHDADQRYPTALALATAIEHHAARVGEVLGARWIARTMAQVVGTTRVPWIAAPTQVDPPPSGSLVALIVAADPDGAVDPPFGESGDGDGVAVTVAAANAATATASAAPATASAAPATASAAPATASAAPATASAATATASAAPATASAATATSAPRPRHRRPRVLAAALATLAVIGVATVLLLTRPPATTQAPMLPSRALPSASTSAASPVAAQTAPSPTAPPIAAPPIAAPPIAAPPIAAPPIAAPPIAAPPIAAPPIAAPPITAPPITAPPIAAPPITAAGRVPPTPISTVTPKRRLAAPRPARRIVTTPTTAAPATPAAPVSTPTADASAIAPPAPPPPAKVEWKPTLLLPTDGVDAGARP